MNDSDRRHTSDGFDHDAMFADIVAHWGDAAAEPQPVLSPPSENAPGDELRVDETAEDTTAEDTVAENTVGEDTAADDTAADQTPAGHHHSPLDSADGLPAPSQQQAIPAPLAWRAHNVDDEYEEHFAPPPTAPLPVGDLQFWAIIAGMGGGPLLLLYLVFFNRDAGSYWMLTAIAMSVGGFALLVSRLPRDKDEDDDGARL